MKQKEKQKYEKPMSKIYILQTEQFLQTASVTPNGQSSSESQWSPDQEQNGGTIIVDDGQNIAPAKKSSGFWDEEGE